ncbi:disulfide bond formation protein B [Streptomyces sp. NPDC050315]|uniref:disulfide bond formation protein B n=1 Tax=Streptomyces sp. NPDC050315 TaxID=3155039 RepID=UPI0034398BC8
MSALLTGRLTTPMSTPAIPALDPGPPGIIARAQYWFACLFVTGWTGALCAGLYLQFVHGEAPCPLCVVQRMFMVLTLLGAAHIVRQGLRGAVPRRDYLMGWGLALVGCTAGSLAAGWQALPYLLLDGRAHGGGADGGAVYGAGAYGGVVQGLPAGVWAWLFFQASVLAIGAVLVTSHLTTARRIPTQGLPRAAGQAVLFLAGVVIAVSAVAVFLQAGLHAFLPVAPGRYQLLYDLGMRG